MATKSRSGRTGGSRATSVDNSLRGQIAKGLSPGGHVRVISAVYIGKDKTGKPMYQVRYMTSGPGGRGTGQLSVITNKTVTFQGGNIGSPIMRDQASLGGPGKDSNKGRVSGQDVHLQRAKDSWLTWIANNAGVTLTPNQVESLKSFVQNFRGTYQQLNERMKFIEANNPVGPGGIVAEGGDEGEWDFGLDFGGGGGGGGGGGFEPQYVAPDRRVVEDMVSGMLTSLIGSPDPALLKSMTDLYMKDHRRNFDTETEEIDPAMSVLEGIRNTQQYQTIHELRPETEDERAWIGARVQAAKQGGLNLGRTQDFAIAQATAGGDVQDVARAASMAQTREAGTTRGTLLEGQLKETVTNMFRGMAV
jgi:hypothetical protein